MLTVATLVPVLFGMGLVYLATAIGVGVYLLHRSAQLALDPSRQRAMANFHATLVQLTLLLVAAILDASLHA